MMNPIDSPCRGCRDREVGCHAKCGRYAEFRAEVDAYNDEQRMAHTPRTRLRAAQVREMMRRQKKF